MPNSWTNDAMTKTKTTRTQEQIDDSIRLRGLFEKRAGMGQLEFGQRYGIGNQGMVWQYLNADKPKGAALNVAAATKFAEGLRCKIGDFSPTLQREIDRIAKYASGILPVSQAPQTSEHQWIVRTWDAASAETKEIARFALSDIDAPLPAWANDAMRKDLDSMIYRAQRWLRGKQPRQEEQPQWEKHPRKRAAA